MAAKKKINGSAEIVVVLDSSGSMLNLQKDTVTNFNNFIAEQRKLFDNIDVTLISFADKPKTVFAGVPISKVKELSLSDYRPDGYTALNDAIGKALTYLEVKSPSRAIVCIVTDGGENYSKEYTSTQIKEKIQKLENQEGWRFVYLAANVDAFSTGAAIGILPQYTYGWTADKKGLQNMYQAMSTNTCSYFSN
jgi:uncharacterized protein with von Willebrand factor type A (vWA) domain